MHLLEINDLGVLHIFYGRCHIYVILDVSTEKEQGSIEIMAPQTLNVDVTVATTAGELHIQEEEEEGGQVSTVDDGEDDHGDTPEPDGDVPADVGDLDERQSIASGTISNHELSDAESPASREEDAGSEPPADCEMRERRDSGVGSSLTRAPRYL